MPVDPDQIADITRSTVDLYRAAESAILARITRQLAAGIDAPGWAVSRLAQVTALRRGVQRILDAVADRTRMLIPTMVAEAWRAGYGAAIKELPAWLVPADPDAQDARRITSRSDVMESLGAALIEDIGAKHSNVLRHIDDIYRRVIAEATAVSVAGGMTRRDAAQWAYAKLVDRGVVSFVDVRGRTWRLSSYVEMATRTVTQRAAVQGQTDRLTSLGVDTVIVSDSPRECPRCRPWEGKVLSASGRLSGRVELPSMVAKGQMVTVDIAGTLDAARAAGLQHPNCTHSVRAYLPGATKRPVRPTANADGYKAKERQRAIERQIRRWKEREQAALSPAAKKAAAVKVRAWQGEMRSHLAQHPELKRLPYREQIGAGGVDSKGIRRVDVEVY